MNSGVSRAQQMPREKRPSPEHRDSQWRQVTEQQPEDSREPREHVGRRANRRESSKQEAVPSGLATAQQPMPKEGKEPGLTGGVWSPG